MLLKCDDPSALLKGHCAQNRNRTCTLLPIPDFESDASTSSAIWAYIFRAANIRICTLLSKNHSKNLSLSPSGGASGPRPIKPIVNDQDRLITRRKNTRRQQGCPDTGTMQMDTKERHGCKSDRPDLTGSLLFGQRIHFRRRGGQTGPFRM